MMKRFFDPESRAVIVALWLALFACLAMLVPQYVRVVDAEDECAFDTWNVERTPFGLLCINEPEGGRL
jgi:hypothetical protein